jgi:hypothetical protein
MSTKVAKDVFQMVVYSEILNIIENFKKKKKKTHLPQDEALPGQTIPVPYMLVADDAFPLTGHMMKPYATDLNKGSPKRVFSYRLSRARHIVENAMGYLRLYSEFFRNQ